LPTRATLDHLARLYAADADPWGHASRPYERAKHRRTLAAIGPGPFRAAVEVGCGIGPLTAPLAGRCQRLIALDCIPAALAQARARVPSPSVTFVEAAAPAGLPDGRFDLVVLSEVLYFLEAGEVDAVAGWIGRSAAPGCRIVSVNWTGPTGHALCGRAAADRLVDALRACSGGWRPDRRVHEGHILDAIERAQ
jgi:trans-aconitate methyltransferase